MARIKYWIPKKFISREAAFELESTETDPLALAEEVAEDYHSNHDGWESRWPIEFSIELSDGTTRLFVIDREMTPCFNAREMAQGEFEAVHCKTHREFQYDCIDCSDALAEARGY